MTHELDGDPIAQQPCAIQLSGLHHDLLNPRTDDVFTTRVDELSIPRHSFAAILGNSGCGKTTLLTLLGLARKPWRRNGMRAVAGFSFAAADAADDRVVGVNALWQSRRGRRAIDALRRKRLGFCLQRGELLENLTVYENIEIPLRLNRIGDRRKRIEQTLRALGGGDDSSDDASLWRRRGALPSTLSGGEYQRIALARAIVHEPDILFLDEPTGNLDAQTAQQTLTALQRARQARPFTVVMITHDAALARRFADHIVHMHCPTPGMGTTRGFERRDHDGTWRATDSHWRERSA